MLIDTNNLVSATEFNRNTGRYTALAAEGHRIVIIKDQQLVAALVGIHDLNRLDALDAAPELAFGDTPNAEAAQPSEPPPGVLAINDTPNVDDTPNAEAAQPSKAPPGVLVIGHTITGVAAYVDPRQSLMVIGRGASDVMSALLTRTGEKSPDLDLQFVITSEQPILLPSPSAPDRAPTILSSTSSPTSHAPFCRLAEQVAGEIDRRTALLAEHSVNTIDQLRRLSSDAPANLVIVVDDADRVDPATLNHMVSEINRSGEKLGISVWLFASTASHRSVLPPMEISQRVALPMETPAQSRDVVYNDIAYRLKPGQAALLKRGGELTPFRIPVAEDLPLSPALPTAPPEQQWPPLPTSPLLESIVGDSDQAEDGSAPRLPIGVVDQPRLHSHPVFSLTLTPGELTDVKTENRQFARAFIGIVMRSASLAAQPVRFLYIGDQSLIPVDRASRPLASYTWEHFLSEDPSQRGIPQANPMTEIPAEARTDDGTTVLIADTLTLDEPLIITNLVDKAMHEDHFHVLVLRRGGPTGERTLRPTSRAGTTIGERIPSATPEPATTIYSRGVDHTFLDRETVRQLKELPSRWTDHDGITPDGYFVLAQ